jgi:outer membrane autotransporter protein
MSVGTVGNGLVTIYSGDVPCTWTGGAGNGNWSILFELNPWNYFEYASMNWNYPFVSGDIVHFAGSNQTAVDTVTNQSVSGLYFDPGASQYTISNNTITLAGQGDIENNSTNTQTINSAIILEAPAVFAAYSGNLAFGGQISFGANSPSLAITGSNSTSITGNIVGQGMLTKSGTGTLTLTGNNTLTGGTTLLGGVLQTLHAKALGNGVLTLSSGTLALGNATTTNLTLSGLTDLVWSSSNAVISLANGGNMIASGNFTNGGNSGNRTFDFGSGQYLQPGNNTLVSFGSTTFNATHFLASASPGTSLSGNFQIIGNSLVYVLQGGSASGSLINNSGVGGTQTWMDFTVNGSVTTPIGNHTIRSLTFTNNGNLAIHAGYALTLSQGQVAVENGSSVVSGGTLATPGNFNKTGSGELDVQSTLSVNGTASIDAGLLSVNGNLIANSVAVGSGNGGNAGLWGAALQVNGQLTANTVVVGNPGHSAGGGFATNTLTVNGQLAANSLVVNQGGALGGSGTIFAPVTVSGTLAPGNSPGTLSMAALTLTPTAVTDIEIESLTNFDRLVVGGAATVDGTLNVIPYNANPLAYGQQYSFLTAGGGISGEFDTITAPATFRGRFLKLGTITALQAIYVPADDLTGILLIAPDTYTRVAVTPNQRNVAVALDTFIPATSGDQQTVSIALDLQTAEQYPTAFEQIMPGFYESLANIAIEQTFNQTQMLNQRISSVRLGASGFQAIGGITQPLLHDKNGKSAAEAKDASPIVESATATNWNAWALGIGMFSRTTNLGSLQNYNNDAGGFLVGSDYRWSENFVTGLYAGYDYSYAEYNGGGSTKGNSFSFGTYASYEKDGYYADAVIGGGYTGFQTQRSIAFGTIDRTASADPNSGQFTAGLNLGKDFEVGKFTLGPIVGAQYTYAGIGSFTESGAESLDLSLGQQNANSLRSNLGARLAYNWEVGSNITLIPEIRAFWMHEFLNNSRNISSALDGGNGASFDYETEAPYRNSIFGGVGVSAKVGDRWNASVFYNVNFGSENYTNNIISTSLGFSF